MSGPRNTKSDQRLILCAFYYNHSKYQNLRLDHWSEMCGFQPSVFNTWISSAGVPRIHNWSILLNFECTSQLSYSITNIIHNQWRKLEKIKEKCKPYNPMITTKQYSCL